MKTTQQQIIKTLGVKPEINPEAEIDRRTTFLRDYLIESGLDGYVLGISGGQDSLLAGTLSQKAVKACRQMGHEATFHAVLLPYGQQADGADAELACDFIKPDVIHEWNIKAATDALSDEFYSVTEQKITDFNKGNIKARMRMIAQYAIAGNYSLLVIGTDHAAEAVTGFFTKYGDGGADVTPLSGLTKRQGRQLLKILGAPEKIYNKKPTADLLDGQPSRPDEDELGISYESIDDYLEGKHVGLATAQAIERRYQMTQHKRALPVTV